MNIFKDSRIQCSVVCMLDQDCYAYNIIKRNGLKKNGCQIMIHSFNSFEENEKYDSFFNYKGELQIEVEEASEQDGKRGQILSFTQCIIQCANKK